ncbi:abasic site processing protein HMCES isoform X3 [Cinclus cinclus]|uniref:abasic site processing protein HMCES isoform X3 n=1 Tax=Cinclus cinclus TaxID=127875 RepID=UPI002E119358
MCGRTACSLAADNLRRACAYRDRRGRHRQPEWVRQERYQPSYNKGPQSSGPVLLSRRHLHQGALLKGKRCVVLADGFYEWQQQQSGGKQPYFIYFPQTKDAMGSIGLPDKEVEGDEEWKGWRLLTMAGIFDCWEPPGGGEMLYTYTIITVDASKDVSFIHHRMPAILDGDEAIRKWLDFAEVPTQEAVKLIQPTENIVFHPVSTFVNNIRNNTPECVARIELGAKKDVKATPSNKVMLGWLKSSQEGSPQKKENDLPKWTSQFIHSPSPKKTSASVLQQWLGKQEQPAAKKHKA